MLISVHHNIMNSYLINEKLIIQYFAGNVNDKECQLILSWLNESHENEKLLFILKDIYDGMAREQFFSEAATDEGWKRFQNQIKESQNITVLPKVKKIPGWVYDLRKYAAVLLAGILGTTVFFLIFPQKNDFPAEAVSIFEIKTQKGERTTVALPDGSTVKLNACSYLAYYSDYENNRKVLLTGEAYFDIHTNPDIPFTVRASGLNIKAYGTSFNVKAYEDEDLVETTLVKGIVNIETHDDRNIVILKPNQAVAIPKSLINTGREHDYAVTEIKSSEPAATQKQARLEAKPVLIDDVKPEVYTSWKDDKWIINAENLESLSKKIERKYDVTVDIRDDASKRYAFSGTLRNYPLEQVLDIIRLNAPIEYSVKEKTVTIKEDKQLKKKYDKLIQQPNKMNKPMGQ
jgi:ferric-dicitrate binding protein FerR (iron transport regulator)